MNYINLLKEYRLFSKQYENQLINYYENKNNKIVTGIDFAAINLSQSFSTHLMIEVGRYDRTSEPIVEDKFLILIEELESL